MEVRFDDIDSLEDLFRTCYTGTVRHTETGQLIDLRDEGFVHFEEFSFEGVYEHYKTTPENPKLYYVGKLVCQPDTGECLVLYIPLYETDDRHMPARPLDVFKDEVEHDDKLVPRFSPLTDHAVLEDMKITL
ncbi:MAG TPA: DUF1653 domain-containing protein [Candidatus Saccharibacteria bacterium]|nr:DUF1653 domain-containing protein [Candidatus Saccharibacteria bacterium]